jgi:hypothetical protein
LNRCRVISGFVVITLLTTLHASNARAAECGRLESLELPHAKITSAVVIEAGTFTPANAASTIQPPTGEYPGLPAFCRVAGVSSPAADSSIGFEVWMPVSGWNGKLVGVGNGAWAGTLPYPAMADSLSKGYATAATDGGHQGSPLNASFAVGHPEKLVDFGHRALHETTVAAKAVIYAYYDRQASRSLFASCSTGGRQGLMEAYRYPDDYDGISSMAPANPVVTLMVGSLWTSAAVSKEAASRIPPATFDLVHKAVVARCDADDGVRDGIIGAPQRCDFDPAALQCKPGADAAGCLAAPQVSALRAIYQGPRNPRTGKPIFPGFAPGSETMLPIQAAGEGPIAPVLSYFRDMVYNDPQWDFRSFDYDRGVALAMAAHDGATGVPATGLDAYLANGRKLLLSHGWSDPLVPPMASVDFYRAMTAHLGTEAAKNARLFMIPGMGHCGGGDGPFVFDAIAVLDQWVETGRAPERIVASTQPGARARTRPLCPFPRQALYSGAGSTDDEKNFRCEEINPH